MPDWPYHEVMEKYLKDSLDVMRSVGRRRQQTTKVPPLGNNNEPERKADSEPLLQPQLPAALHPLATRRPALLPTALLQPLPARSRP
jgi:hypothetical protein